MTVALEGAVPTPGGLVAARVRLDARVREVRLLGPAPDDLPLLLPGFIDVHVHGGGGGDTMDGPDGVRTLARAHLAHGTTTLLPTTITNPFDRILEALEGVARVAAERDPDLPDLPGAHLEGPFLSPRRLGAQPPFPLEPAPELVDAALASGSVRVVTLAPELPGAREAARRIALAGARVSLGHARATAEDAREAAEAVRAAGGTVGGTHLFNAMGGIEGREPGLAGALLADPEAWTELILDGHHVHPVSFRAALAAKGERLLLVTDAIRATGLGDGPTELGGRPVEVAGGAARLADGTLAGSVLTMDRAFANAVAAGVPEHVASHLTSAAPARYLGLDDRGRLEPGLRADLVRLERGSLRVLEVRVEGRVVGGG